MNQVTSDGLYDRNLSFLSDLFMGGVYHEAMRDTENGGPDCAFSMNTEFKLTVTVLAVS